MSVQVISWRRIKQLNRKLGENFIHAYTRDHGLWTCVRHDASAERVNTRTLEKLGSPQFGSVTRTLLETRAALTPHDHEMLAELDRRFEEWEQAKQEAER